jgi:tRNA(fMet)-specific endonuclease VapC
MRHLDTNIVVAYLKGDRAVAAQLSAALPDIAISSLVLAELLYGARLSARAAQNINEIEQFMRLVSLAAFDRASADAYSRLRAAMRQQGKATGEVDALIAAVALAHDAVLVTHNTRHFSSVPGLKLEDWL